jgi:hypothetical protein
VKVFISWSGNRSRVVAEALKTLIKNVLPDVKAWVSSENLAPGVLWSPQILKEIAEASGGILCLTKENMTRPWILFEAGGLAALFQGREVYPYLLDFSPTELPAPLSLLNASASDLKGTLSVLLAINNQRTDGKKLEEEFIKGVFGRFWPAFAKRLEHARKMTADLPALQRDLSQVKADAIASIVKRVFRKLESLAAEYAQLASEHRKLAKEYNDLAKRQSRAHPSAARSSPISVRAVSSSAAKRTLCASVKATKKDRRH